MKKIKEILGNTNEAFALGSAVGQNLNSNIIDVGKLTLAAKREHFDVKYKKFIERCQNYINDSDLSLGDGDVLFRTKEIVMASILKGYLVCEDEELAQQFPDADL
jgi:hypothetical protein